jgi:RNA polymerase sigma-70 factor (ECF subfamily)
MGRDHLAVPNKEMSMSVQDDPTSRSLLYKASVREAGAWERLLTLYSPLVDYWCRKAGVPRDDVRDVAQEVFASVAKGLASYNKDRPGASFRAWMHGVTRHKILDYFRQGAGQAEGGSEALLRFQTVPALVDETEASENDAAVAALYRRALELVRAQFEEQTWTAFWKVAIENRSPAEVAIELGLTQNSVRKAKSRVLRRIKDEVGDLIA